MDLRTAYEILGLVRGASSEEVEAAYARLRDAVEARLARVNATAVAARYRDVRAGLDRARETLLAAPAPPPAEPLAHAFEILGLAPNASPLDVASAYVTLCEEIDREIQEAPTEALRRACLEARADVDTAYQRCALSPLRDVAEPPIPGAAGERPALYETQMSAETFEAPEVPAPQEPVLRIEPDEGTSRRSKRRDRRRGRRRRLAVAASVALLLVGIGLGAVGWAGIDLRATLARLVPDEVVSWLAPRGPLAELVEARTTAESLRHRVSEERVELQSRVAEARQRAEDLQRSWASAEDPVERERMAAELDRVRARRELAVQQAELAERHVLASDELTVVYGKMERANDLVQAGDEEHAVALYSEVRPQLEAALARLDVVEEAVGARSEAEAGLEAWRALAASAGLGELEPATLGTAVLTRARELLAGGDFDAAVRELRRASQHFAAALSEGRKLAAASRAEATEQAASRAEAAEDEPPPSPDLAAAVPADATQGEAKAAPAVSAPPPSRARAAIKLVLVPGGDFLYGCNAALDSACAAEEPTGRRVALDAFRIDRTEVRVDEYRSCVAAGSCTAPGTGEACNWGWPDRGDHPQNCVDWHQARSYCAWVGKRLPSEREWEKAARGTDGQVYPWGNGAATCDRAVISGDGAPGCGRGSTSPVGSRARGRSPFGLFDMAGNVLEWTADEAEAGMRVVRGGSWLGDAVPARASSREKLASGTRDASVGFRCAQDAGLYAVTSP